MLNGFFKNSGNEHSNLVVFEVCQKIFKVLSLLTCTLAISTSKNGNSKSFFLIFSFQSLGSKKTVLTSKSCRSVVEIPIFWFFNVRKEAKQNVCAILLIHQRAWPLCLKCRCKIS